MEYLPQFFYAPIGEQSIGKHSIRNHAISKKRWLWKNTFTVAHLGENVAYVDLDDEQVVARVFADKEAFAVLITRYEEKLLRYVARLGIRSQEDRQDILQESFL